MAREGRLLHEKTLIGRDGRRIPVEINTRMVPYEGRDMVVSIIHDVSERRRFEEERAHLAAIVQYSHDAIVAETLDGIITDWNRGAVELFGYEANEVVGQSVGMLFPPGCREAELTMRETLRQGLSLRDYDTVRIRKDGSSIPVFDHDLPDLRPVWRRYRHLEDRARQHGEEAGRGDAGQGEGGGRGIEPGQDDVPDQHEP